MLVVYNSLSRTKEKFQPLNPPLVKMYCCGPTVYDFLHVGNFRGAVFYNFVRSWLEQSGYQVTFVYNYTDVDDKIINRANKEGVESNVISEKYIAEFEKDFDLLKLKKHSFNPRVSEFIPQIIEIVETLINKNKAYVVNGEVLYSISSFSEYGKLSGRNPEELQAGSRVEVDQKKHNPLDFALWKPAKPGEPSWDSPWGKGRPGWHIECSAMVKAILGEQIDIHGGGSDLIFPHHENEIAQSEGCTEHQLAKYWIHNNMFTFSGQKMSKSLGNILKARDFLTEYHPEIFKYMIMSVHYRSLSEFSELTAEYAIKALGRIYSSLSLAEFYLKDTKELIPNSNSNLNIKNQYQEYLEQVWLKVHEAFDDDFSTPEAFSHLFEVVRDFNGRVKRGMKVTPQLIEVCLNFKNWILKFGSLMSLFQEPAQDFLTDLDNRLLEKKNLKRVDVDQLISERQQARTNKDFKRSDELRDQLIQLGISVSDTPTGPVWEVAK